MIPAVSTTTDLIPHAPAVMKVRVHSPKRHAVHGQTRYQFLRVPCIPAVLFMANLLFYAGLWVATGAYCHHISR
jgi:hypothetical protein